MTLASSEGTVRALPDSSGAVRRPMAGPCEQGHQTAVSVKGAKCIDELLDKFLYYCCIDLVTAVLRGRPEENTDTRKRIRAWNRDLKRHYTVGLPSAGRRMLAMKATVWWIAFQFAGLRRFCYHHSCLGSEYRQTDILFRPQLRDRSDWMLLLTCLHKFRVKFRVYTWKFTTTSLQIRD
jgi:hypothetical protein